MSDTVRGVAPGFLLMPAREYEWQLVRKIEIEIPNEGSISELIGSSYTGSLQFLEPDDFLIFSGDFVSLWEAVKILFATSQYPDLEDDQCLNVVGLSVHQDKVKFYGEIIRSL